MDTFRFHTKWSDTSSMVAPQNAVYTHPTIVTMFPRQAAVDPKSMLGRASDKITIIHFNDVADTEARDSEPCGGAARCKYFKTEIDNNKILI